jgi:dihydrofolate reductase
MIIRLLTAQSCTSPPTHIDNSQASITLHAAMSLEGFIAGPKGACDWIVHDPTVAFGARFCQFETLLMGRRTFDLAQLTILRGPISCALCFVTDSVPARNAVPDVLKDSRNRQSR